ncbi:MAG: oxidoreductase-like protein [Piptocephalis tieghemiana]|nr:MAG: oxidoreductase-like protein [Piptocephalis tieghemiana]
MPKRILSFPEVEVRRHLYRRQEEMRMGGCSQRQLGSSTTAPPPQTGLWVQTPQGSRILLPPPPDSPGDCCMSGCAHCVWDVYNDERELFDERLGQIKRAFIEASLPLPPTVIQAEKDADAKVDPGMRAFLEMEARGRTNVKQDRGLLVTDS